MDEGRKRGKMGENSAGWRRTSAKCCEMDKCGKIDTFKFYVLVAMDQMEE